MVLAWRRAEPWWFLIILVLHPVGPVIYFLFVKLDGSARGGRGRERSLRKVPLDQLRKRAAHVESLENLVDLGFGLIDTGKYDEALSVFEKAHLMDRDSDRATFGHGRCLLELGRREEAAECLAPLVERQPAMRNYEGWLCFARALLGSGRHAEGMDSLRRLAATSGSLAHQVILTECLLEADQRDDARRNLDQALAEFEFAPRFVQRRDRSWLSRARKLKRTLA